MEFSNTLCKKLEDSPMYLKIILPQRRSMENWIFTCFSY